MAQAKRAPAKDNPLVFEFPLAERMRGFLRLEATLTRIRAQMASDRADADHEALASLVELAALSERSELKREILSELERQRMLLEQLANSSEVDGKRLDQAVSVLEQAQLSVAGLPKQLGLHLKTNEFLTTLRSRITIPGGTCAFDLPSLHFWLARPADERKRDLENWMADMAPVEEALWVLLEHVRQAAPFEAATAPGGIYEYSPPIKHPPLLLRIRLDPATGFYPQISGSRHRVTIQFQRWQGIDERPELLRRDFDFDLAICRL
ncbi:MAG: cell division protein ZapD [Gammaproteobacteria bacterium]|nr:cell division protein ZapD [Gammaproteobacteria bacterium]